MTRVVGGRLKASGLNGANGRVAEAVSEIAGDAQYLDGAGGRDAKTNRDDAFNMKLDGLRGVLWLGFKENLGSALRGGGRGSGRLRHRRGRVLAEIDGAGDTARSFIGPVPPVTPSLTPATAAAALSWPFMFWLVAEPEPRLTMVACAPAPLLEAGMPDIPLLPRLMAVVEGDSRLRWGWSSTKRDGRWMRSIIRNRSGHRLGQVDNLTEPAAAERASAAREERPASAEPS